MKKRAETKANPQARRRRLDQLVLLDDDGEKVRAGDSIRFSYGMPPVVVDAKIVQRRGQLIALTPGHYPAECNLRSLRKYVGGWHKPNPSSEARPSKGENNE